MHKKTADFSSSKADLAILAAAEPVLNGHPPPAPHFQSYL
jgi:hypothetical protein